MYTYINITTMPLHNCWIISIVLRTKHKRHKMVTVYRTEIKNGGKIHVNVKNCERKTGKEYLLRRDSNISVISAALYVYYGYFKHSPILHGHTIILCSFPFVLPTCWCVAPYMYRTITHGNFLTLPNNLGTQNVTPSKLNIIPIS